MITHIPHARRMNLIALALLISALVAFAAFHFLPLSATNPYEGPTGDYEERVVRGWRIWDEVRSVLFNRYFDDILSLIAISAFLSSSLITCLSPLLLSALAKSRLIWWMGTSMSGLVLVSLSVLTVASSPDGGLGPAWLCFLASLALNFLGLLFIRRELPAAPEVDSA